MIVPAQHVSCLRVTLSDLLPLRFESAAPGLPPYVRSASALRRWNSRLVIVQDDVHALAFLSPTGEVTPFALPPLEGGAVLFDDAHNNKSEKLDLESALALPDGRLLAFGSGATSARERIIVVHPAGGAHVVDAAAFYAMLRSEPEFAGEELNLEGAVRAGDRIRLLQRGNGARSAGAAGLSAIGDVSLSGFLNWLDRHGAVPALLRIVQVDLGEIQGIRFGFTDATLTPAGEIAFLACAEDSTNAVSDGPVLGCRFGMISGDEISITDVVDAAGKPVTLKLEGIEIGSDRDCYDVVADQDLPDEPALLGKLTVTAS